MKSKQFPLYILTLVLSINLFVGYSVFSESRAESKNDQVDSVRVFTDAVKLLRDNYVDQDQVEYKKLVYAAIRGMVKELDRHSRFHSPIENKEVKEDSAGKFAGIGVTMSYIEKQLTVKRIIPDGPASKSKLEPQDVIIAVDGTSLKDKGMDEARSLIKGERGSEVVLTVFRANSDSELQVPIVRDIVTIPSVTRVRKLSDSNIGYMYIDQFTRDTDRDFEATVKKFNEEKVKALIVDLRGNPGGVLDTAINMCSLFVPEDELVLYTQGRDPSNRQDYLARGGDKYLDIPIVLLINEGSASASEILSACLKDYGKAVLIGTKTYGKGSVQTIIDLRDGSALRFTIAKYYTKSGKTIHNVGISPDIIVEIPKEEEKELNSMLRDLFPNKDELDDFDERDLQLQSALSLLNGFLDKKEAGQSINEYYRIHEDKLQKDLAKNQKKSK